MKVVPNKTDPSTRPPKFAGQASLVELLRNAVALQIDVSHLPGATPGSGDVEVLLSPAGNMPAVALKLRIYE